MKKILFGITNLSIGGAEKVLVDLCHQLCSEYEINIFTLYPNGEFEKNLPENVRVKSLYKKDFEHLNKLQKLIISTQILLFKNSIYKKQIDNKYDIEIAFLEGPITTLLSSPNSSAKKIAWIHNDIKLVFGKNLKSKIKRVCNKKIYSKYQTLVFVSKHNLDKFDEVYAIPCKKEVIHNYLDINSILSKAQTDEVLFPNDGVPNFVSVCRLVEQKAVDRLVEVHYDLIKSGFLHRIYIVGDGPLKPQLQELVSKLNIQETFILLGAMGNPYPYVKQADYFCLLSHYEGFPMVLLEATALNKYIIITDTASKEVLENYPNKLIVSNDKSGIFDGLKSVIQNGVDQIENYSYNENDKIIEQINKLL